MRGWINMTNRKFLDAGMLLAAAITAGIYAIVATVLISSTPSFASFYRYDRSEALYWLESANSGTDANPYFYFLSYLGFESAVGLEFVAFFNLTVALFLVFRATSHLTPGLRAISFLFVIPASIFFFTSGRTVTAMLLVCLLHLEWRHERRWRILSLLAFLIYLIRPADLVTALLVIGTLTSYVAPLVLACIPVAFPELGEFVLLEVLDRNSGDQLLGNLSYRGLYDMPVSIWDLPSFLVLPITRLPEFISDPTVLMMLCGIGFALLAISQSKLMRGTAAFMIVLLGVAAFSSNYSSLFRWVLPHAVAFLIIASDEAQNKKMRQSKTKNEKIQEERTCAV